MTANKMPVLPRAYLPKGYPFMTDSVSQNLYAEADVIADRLACYLAGLEAAKACVPAQRFRDEHDDDVEWASVGGHNDCRNKTLTNLTALEQEAK